MCHAGYNANMVSAGDSDARLIHRLDNSSSAFSALSLDLAISQMPRLQVFCALSLPGLTAWNQVFLSECPCLRLALSLGMPST